HRTTEIWSKDTMKVIKVACLAVAIVLLTVAPAFAYVTKNQDASGKTVETGGPDHSLFSGGAVGAGLGAALTIVGAGYGFGRIGAAALESMARQPEVAGRIGTSMIIIAALLEGATFFALIICITIGGRSGF